MFHIPFDNSYARLPEDFFKKVSPSVPSMPTLIRVNTELASFIGLDVNWLESSEGLAMLSGQKLPQGADPIAMAYAGHQFGGWSPKLGDGRALLIGEVIAKDGVRRDIQLKGSGHTPFSRSGDGKSALGPVLREYIVSEAMAALGVPTTRALAAVTTGENVVRNAMEPGGVFTRVAQSHVRIGTFQYFYARQDNDAVKVLADYVIERHYPEALSADNPYAALLNLIAARQAELIAKWMSLGFIHGVMNTDNMQIAGETIDYGPCAFMDDFHPQKVFSSIDQYGRYAWGKQSEMGQWNLMRLADTLLPLIDDDLDRAKNIAQEAIQNFNQLFVKSIFTKFSRKLGLLCDHESQNDLIASTFELMTENEVDFTLFFRHLTKVYDGGDTDFLCQLFKDPAACENWLIIWHEYLARDDGNDKERLKIMRAHNPILIPRNHRIAEAIKAGEQGDFKAFHRLIDALAKPYDEQPEYADLEQAPEAVEIVHQTFCGT
ncbi:MAG: YdiU family protein [Kordiimonadaceae bacterium]|nr:YdiU family protein [Kordiimonadaceae bacterium]MBT6033368.1 YdiU family protein [Kordiimonadaceae bacterium]